MHCFQRRCGEEPATWIEFLELDAEGRLARQISCSGYPWPGDAAAKYCREYPRDRDGEMSSELRSARSGPMLPMSPARFNFLWVATRGSNPAAYGLSEWGEALPKAVPTLPGLLLAEFRCGTEEWEHREEVERLIAAMSTRLACSDRAEQWTDFQDGEYRTVRYLTVVPLLYHAWHARYPGKFLIE